MEQYEAVALFVDRVQNVEPGFRLQDENAGAVAHICSRLDGIPLALEMAAAWTNVLTIQEIATRLSGALDARFQLLTNSSRTVSHRQQTLRATMEWSFALLSPSEQRLLLRLPVFAGSWTLAAAEKVCADCRAGGIAEADVLPLLAALIQKSLVIADREDGQTRYRMLETIRQFAVEKMSMQEKEFSELHERHFAYFLDLAENPPIHMLAGPPMSAKMGSLHRERENIRAALEWGRVQPGYEEQQLRFVGALGLYWYYNGFHHEGDAWMSAALERGRNAEAGLRGKVYVAMALPMWGIDTHRMAELAERGLALCREGNELFSAAYALSLLGAVAHRKEKYQQSELLFEESLRVARASGSPEAIWNALFPFGMMLLDQGQEERACELFEACVAEAQAWQDARYMLHPLRRLSFLNPDKAMAVCQSELARLRKAGEAEGLAGILNALGIILLDRGDCTGALLPLRESLSIWASLGLQWHWVGGTARVLADLARAAWLSGDLDTAAAGYQESMRQFREVSDHEQLIRLQALYGCVALARGEVVVAQACFKESLEQMETMAVWKYLCVVLAGLGEALNLQGKPIQAASMFGAAVQHGSRTRVAINPSEMVGYDRLVMAERARLGDPNLASAWDAGQAMVLEDLKALVET